MRAPKLSWLVLALALATSSCVGDRLMKITDGVQHALNLGTNARLEEEQKDALTLAAEGDRLRDARLPDYTAAHDAYRLALQLEPRNPYIHVAIATAYIRQAASEHEKSKPSVWRWFGDSVAARNAKKYFNRAIGVCKEALQINPNHSGAHFALAEAYARMEDWSTSAQKLDEIEAKRLIGDRQEAAFYAWRGYVRMKMGNRSGARDDFEKSIEFGRPQPFAEYAEYVANPPSFLEMLFSFGGATQFDPVVGVER
jgi:tetratricopeptide (TPR) repeat protein